MINGHFNKRTADNLFLSMGTTFSYKKLSKEQTLLINGHIIFLHRKCALIRVSTVYLEKKIEISTLQYRAKQCRTKVAKSFKGDENIVQENLHLRAVSLDKRDRI